MNQQRAGGGRAQGAQVTQMVTWSPADPCDEEFGALGVCTLACECTHSLSPTAFTWGSLDTPVGFPAKETSSRPVTNDSAHVPVRVKLGRRHTDRSCVCGGVGTAWWRTSVGLPRGGGKRRWGLRGDGRCESSQHQDKRAPLWAPLVSVPALGALTARLHVVLAPGLWEASLGRSTGNTLQLSVGRCLARCLTAGTGWSRVLPQRPRCSHCHHMLPVSPALPTGGSLWREGEAPPFTRGSSQEKGDGSRSWLREGQSPVDTVGRTRRQSNGLDGLAGLLQEAGVGEERGASASDHLGAPEVPESPC